MLKNFGMAMLFALCIALAFIIAIILQSI